MKFSVEGRLTVACCVSLSNFCDLDFDYMFLLCREII